jgi:undecaprenyl-diphosphatase
VLLLVFSAVFIYREYDNFHTVVPGRIFRSAQLTAEELSIIIDEEKIRTIINLRGASPEERWYVEETNVARQNGLKYYDFKLASTALPRYTHLKALLRRLQQAPRPVLIHCLKGADRSGMAGALALAIEKDPPLNELKRQVSWRFLALHPSSVGKLFFAEYEKWLQADKDRRHNLATLTHWIENEYIDGQGSIEYWIDSIGGVRFEKDWRERYIAYVPTTSEKVVLRGWTFDLRRKKSVNPMVVGLGDDYRVKVEYFQLRPDVVKRMGLNPARYRTAKLGWRAVVFPDKIDEGCRPISIRFRQPYGTILTFQSKFYICK